MEGRWARESAAESLGLHVSPSPDRRDPAREGQPERSGAPPTRPPSSSGAAGACSAQVRPRPRVPARPPSPRSLAHPRKPNAGPRTQTLGPDDSVATSPEVRRLPGCPRCGALGAERHRGPTASPAVVQPGPCRSSPAEPRPALPSAGHALDTPQPGRFRSDTHAEWFSLAVHQRRTSGRCCGVGFPSCQSS